MSGVVWIVDDDASIREVMKRALDAGGLAARTFDTGDRLFEALSANPAPDVVISDLRMPGMDGRELLDRLGGDRPDLPVVIMTAYADLESSVDLLARGAFDLLPKPFDIHAAVALVRRALKTPSTRSTRNRKAAAKPNLIGQAPAMKQLFRTIGRLAGSELSVLLIGESGTGKERVARALHDHSPRSKGPFIAINVAAIPAELLESELFGHEKGAFSGADQARAGHFERAAGGTLFLDEIGDMPAAMQTRLLRVLADGDFYRLGASRPRSADVRLIAATHQDLEAAIQQHRFREDLYHRLNVVQIQLPPLRERREDVSPLLDHYLQCAGAELDTAPKTLSSAARHTLEQHRWPGNIRELVNLCHRLTVMVPGSEIRAEDLPMTRASAESSATHWTEALRHWARTRLADGENDLLPTAQQQLEDALIEEALNATGHQIGDAARRLGIGRNTLARKRRIHEGGS